MTATVTRKPTTLDHPALAAFLATVEPGAELTTLREALEGLYGRRASINERATEVRRRLAEIDEALVEATGPERDTLAIERGARAGEEAALPGALAVVVERLALAELSYLQALHGLALAEVARADEEQAGPLGEWRAIVRALHRREGQAAARERVAEAEVAELHAERDRLAAAMRPAQQRREWLAEVAGVCAGRAELLYGARLTADPSGLGPAGHSWEQAAREAGERAARGLRTA